MSKIYNEITIITVLYNSSEIVKSFFDSLKNFKIIVVDNGKNEKILGTVLCCYLSNYSIFNNLLFNFWWILWLRVD